MNALHLWAFVLSFHPLPLIYFIKHTCLPLHPTVIAMCVHTNTQAHMLLVSANYIKPLLVDALTGREENNIV